MSDDPESTCQRCGRPNITWFVASPLWNACQDQPDIVCPSCFVAAFEAAGGGDVAWELVPDPMTTHHLRADLLAASSTQKGTPGDS